MRFRTGGLTGLLVSLIVAVDALGLGIGHLQPNNRPALARRKKDTTTALSTSSATGTTAASASITASASTSTSASGAGTTTVTTLSIGGAGLGTLTIVSGSTGTGPVLYSGAAISSIEVLPSIISQVVFPTSAPLNPFDVTIQTGLGNNALSQLVTNGQSLLGTFKAPTFANWTGSGSCPWGNLTVGNTNPYQNAPNTGVTRTYNFEIARATLSPDGVQRQVLLVNGQFPGPAIEANWGDMIQVTVKNSISAPQEGTAIHWHGFLQKSTPWFDGVPGITQCPIPPGQSFTYTFKADLYGTSWYHSHYSAQYAGGAVGPIIIHGPNHVPFDVDLGPVMLSDYFHRDYDAMVQRTMARNLNLKTLYSDNNLINGKGVYNCSLVTDGTPCTANAGYSRFYFAPGLTYKIRLINAGAEGIQKFSIDNHQMNVIAYDFIPINPYKTNVVTLGVGQRADVLVTATGNPGDAVWMRARLTSCALANQPNGFAMVYYPGANTNSQPSTSAWTDNSDPCANDALSLTTPYYPITPGQPVKTQTINLGFTVNSTGNFLWTMDGSSFRVNYNNPTLILANQGATSYEADWNVYNMGSSTSFRIVIQNKTPSSHPMHIHGHNMYIINEGTGTWDGTVINANNTMRRDVQMLRPKGYMVFQVDSDNPGVWPFHCHIAWHVSGGLYVNILERPSDVQSYGIPQPVNDLCSAWNSYTNTATVDMIDSGLKALLE